MARANTAIMVWVITMRYWDSPEPRYCETAKTTTARQRKILPKVVAFVDA
jgi:uncharacterized membrane protein YedE/YeeE